MVLLAGLIACSGSASTNGTAPPAPTPATTIPTVQHFAVVVLENANYSDVVGSASMPYLNSLIAQGGLATHYFANAHPSIPNYFVLTTGTAVTFDDSFNGVVTTENVVRDLASTGKTWKAYIESIPSAGFLGGDTFPYLRRHDPFSFFSDVQQNPAQAANIVPLTQLATDMAAGTLPNYIYIAPNAINDAHSCADGRDDCPQSTRLATADQWLSTNIQPLLSNATFTQSGMLAITFDESANDFTNVGGQVATVLIGSHVRPGFQGTNTYDHRSLLGLSMTALSTPIPNGAGSATQMAEFFQ